MIEVQSLQLDQAKRSIVISDIHANLKLFQKLLDKLNYTKEDYLFINGDLCEKGPNSLEVVEFVRALSTESEKVFVTKGNCDVLFRYVFSGSEWIIPYMNKQKHSVLNEMLDKHDQSLADFADLQQLADYYRENFGDKIDWLESLPIAYETEDHIIIHAGIDNLENWQQTDEDFALSTQSFYDKEHQADKTVIVGHWPVVNYRAEQISSHNPLIDLEKRIIALDGGNQIKVDGQLNALIIENGMYSFTFVDELENEMIVQREYVGSPERKGTVTYPNYDMNVIRKEEFFTLCKNRKLGIQQWVKNEYLVDTNGRTMCRDDLSTTFLSVTLGEKVWLIDNACAGYNLVKKSNGEVGWIPK